MANQYANVPETPPSADVYLQMSEKEKNQENQRAINRLRRIVVAIQYQADQEMLKADYSCKGSTVGK